MRALLPLAPRTGIACDLLGGPLSESCTDLPGKTPAARLHLTPEFGSNAGGVGIHFSTASFSVAIGWEQFATESSHSNQENRVSRQGATFYCAIVCLLGSLV